LATKEIIYQNFSYSNSNRDMNIGEAFPTSKMMSTITDRNLNPSVSNANLIFISKTSCEANEYQFVLPRSFIERIRNFELNNGTGISISGLTDLYEPKVS